MTMLVVISICIAVCAVICANPSSIVDQLLDLHPNLREQIDPVCYILAVTMLAWLLIPLIFREMHKSQGPALVLCGTRLWARVCYQRSFLAALEGPVLFLVTFSAFLLIGDIVEPAIIASGYAGPSWWGALMVSCICFMNRWRKNVVARALVMRSIAEAERQNLLIFDKVSTIYQFFVGLFLLAMSFRMVVPIWFSIVSMTMVVAIGGLVLLFHLNGPVIPSAGIGLASNMATKDIYRNVRSGVTLLMFQPFSIGNRIRVDNVVGQVVGTGLTTTCFLMADGSPITVPNSFLLKLLHTNRVVRLAGPFERWDAMVAKFPLRTFDISRIPLISEDIRHRLMENANVLHEEPPFCFLARTEKLVALTLGCSFRYMSHNVFISTKRDLLLQSVEIINRHGATLGCTIEDATSQ